MAHAVKTAKIERLQKIQSLLSGIIARGEKITKERKEETVAWLICKEAVSKKTAVEELEAVMRYNNFK